MIGDAKHRQGTVTRIQVRGEQIEATFLAENGYEDLLYFMGRAGGISIRDTLRDALTDDWLLMVIDNLITYAVDDLVTTHENRKADEQAARPQ